MMTAHLRRRSPILGIALAIALVLSACNLGAQPVTYQAPGNDLEIADVDADGVPDLVSIGAQGYEVMVGDGAGGFSGQVVPDGEELVVGGDLALADLDDDGDLDLATATSRFTGEFVWELHVYLGDGQGAFAPAASWEQATTFLDIADLGIADLDGDDRPDLLVAVGSDGVSRCGGASGLAYYLGDGLGGFEAGGFVTLPNAAPNGATVTDMDHDGDLDIVVAGRQASQEPQVLCGEPALYLLRQDASGAFVPERRTVVANVNGTADGLVMFDFDDDGLDDLATTVQGSIAVFRGQRDGGLSDPIFSATELTQMRTLAAGDIDGDGTTDLAISGANGGGTVAFGDGSGAFVDEHLVGSGLSSVGSVSAADLDGDGRVDLVFLGRLDSGADGVGVLMNRLTGRPDH